MYIITEDGFSLNLIGADCLHFKEKKEIIYDKDICKMDKNGKCLERKFVEIYAAKSGRDWLVKTVDTVDEAKSFIYRLLKIKGDGVLKNDLSQFE